MGAIFGVEESTFDRKKRQCFQRNSFQQDLYSSPWLLLKAKYHSHRCGASPLWGEKPQNRALTELKKYRCTACASRTAGGKNITQRHVGGWRAWNLAHNDVSYQLTSWRISALHRFAVSSQWIVIQWKLCCNAIKKMSKGPTEKNCLFDCQFIGHWHAAPHRLRVR